MTAKEYLNQFSDLKQKIQDNEDERKQLIAQVASLSATDYSKDIVKSSPKQYASFEDIVNMIMQYDEEIMLDNAASIKLERQIKADIERLEDANERSVLRKYYIRSMSFKDIAKEMCYSYRHITRIHGKALQNFSKLYGFPKDISALSKKDK